MWGEICTSHQILLGGGSILSGEQASIRRVTQKSLERNFIQASEISFLGILLRNDIVNA